jgi:hypothetical protein
VWIVDRSHSERFAVMCSLRSLPGEPAQWGQEHEVETTAKILRASLLAARCRYAEVVGSYRR